MAALFASDETEAGRTAAAREIKLDAWTPADARRYLAECQACNCAEGRDDFDRGFMAVVRELAALGS